MEVVRSGIDDVTLYWEYANERLAALNALPYVETAAGHRLGAVDEYGKFRNLFGRHYAVLKPSTGRLFVQAKLAPAGWLAPPHAVSQALDRVTREMAEHEVAPMGPGWVTRVDVGVDLRCPPDYGRRLLNALGAVRLEGGRRVEMVGDPKSTVYFRPRVGRDVEARSYCRNLKTGEGEPFGLIRLEAVRRFRSQDREPIATIESPEMLGLLWKSRYGKVTGAVTRLSREAQTMKLAEMVQAGQIGYAQMERLSTFLDLERLGLAERTYPKTVLAARRREARSLGLSKNDADDVPLEIGLDELLAPARAVWD